MVIDNLNIIGMQVDPTKTNPVLVVDSDRMLSHPISTQRLELVVRRRLQVMQGSRGIHHHQLTPRHPLEALPFLVPRATLEQGFSATVAKALDQNIRSYMAYVKRKVCRCHSRKGLRATPPPVKRIKETRR
jgi:hypothetical protein